MEEERGLMYRAQAESSVLHRLAGCGFDLRRTIIYQMLPMASLNILGWNWRALRATPLRPTAPSEDESRTNLASSGIRRDLSFNTGSLCCTVISWWITTSFREVVLGATLLGNCGGQRRRTCSCHSLSCNGKKTRKAKLLKIVFFIREPCSLRCLAYTDGCEEQQHPGLCENCFSLFIWDDFALNGPGWVGVLTGWDGPAVPEDTRINTECFSVHSTQRKCRALGQDGLCELCIGPRAGHGIIMWAALCLQRRVWLLVRCSSVFKDHSHVSAGCRSAAAHWSWTQMWNT